MNDAARAISIKDIERSRKITRVKVCAAPTPELLEVAVNQALEALEDEGYGITSVAYGDHVPYTVLITYGRGATTMQRWGGHDGGA